MLRLLLSVLRLLRLDQSERLQGACAVVSLPVRVNAKFTLLVLDLLLIQPAIELWAHMFSSCVDLQTKGKRKYSVFAQAHGLLTCSNVTLVAFWILWGLILLYTQHSASDTKPFDPYDILNLQRGASSADIKRQYRKLALEYHPDKNPDPAASKYFAEYVTKAHTALTDETARKNYEKYGHPDGPQPLDIGIALPEWIFSKDRNTAPLVLAGLVMFGILLPLGVASWYLLRSSNFTGPNHVMAETMNIYFRPNLGVKESQGLNRIPDTLVVAMEFITMPTPNEQGRALEELRKTVLRAHPELKVICSCCMVLT